MDPIPHGTREGYRRCAALLGEACKRYRQAEADYAKAWRKSNSESAMKAKALASIRQKAKTILSHRYETEYLEIVQTLLDEEMKETE